MKSYDVIQRIIHKGLWVDLPNMSQRRTLLPVTRAKTSDTRKRCQPPNLSYHDLFTNTICWHWHLPIFIGSPRRSAGSSLAATIFSGRAWSGVRCQQKTHDPSHHRWRISVFAALVEEIPWCDRPSWFTVYLKYLVNNYHPDAWTCSNKLISHEGSCVQLKAKTSCLWMSDEMMLCLGDNTVGLAQGHFMSFPFHVTAALLKECIQMIQMQLVVTISIRLFLSRIKKRLPMEGWRPMQSSVSGRPSCSDFQAQ